MSGQRPAILLIAATLFSLALVTGALISRSIGLLEFVPEPKGFVLEGASRHVTPTGGYQLRPEKDPVTLTLVMRVNGAVEEKRFDVYPGYALRFKRYRQSRHGSKGYEILVTEYSVEDGLGWALPTPIFRRHLPMRGERKNAIERGDGCSIGARLFGRDRGPPPGELCETLSFTSEQDALSIAYRIDYLTT